MEALTKVWKLIRQALGLVPGVPAPPRPADLPDEVPTITEPKWLKLARKEIGVKEVPGPGNNPEVLRYYADAGHPEINADSVHWCAAFVGAMLERCGVSSSKSLMARSYMQWGKPVAKPFPGCVAVFSRGDPRSASGHVGFYVGEDSRGILVLGGNQDDAVSIAPQDRNRLLGYRMPVTPMNSRTMKASTAQMGLLGLDGVAILESQGQINVIGDLLAQLGMTIPALLVASILLKIALQCVIIYARQDDLAKRGR
jgi:uncharacterized protein (TIGR02594 family)